MVVESANLPKRGIEVYVANLTTRQGACVSRYREKVTGGPCTVLARCIGSQRPCARTIGTGRTIAPNQVLLQG
jgi:hypothetical protein